ncbi:hypothetical protein AV530_012661 [Patagioenas fasciata monilis]|uniref:Uncharacterized protein n=1 Tax=Patagioenas fasciata monilis TaxID=372326 RepID=A0A1V4JBU8_PATFA|nr:hypothetical protein AV530_012661 [Patagioenas fasciata monilis]
MNCVIAEQDLQDGTKIVLKVHGRQRRGRILSFFCSLIIDKTCTAALTNTVINISQSQNTSDLSCIPWLALKSLLGTNDVWIPCACDCALPWDFPKPTLSHWAHKDLQRQQRCPCEQAFSAARLHPGSWAVKTVASGKESPAVNDVALGKPNMWKEKEYKKQLQETEKSLRNVDDRGQENGEGNFQETHNLATDHFKSRSQQSQELKLLLSPLYTTEWTS